SVRGRCKTQALPSASMAILDTSPSFHFAGTFGHEGSTSNIGMLRASALEVCAAVSVPKSHVPSTPATMTKAKRTTRLRFLRFIAPLLYLVVQAVQVVP